MSESESDLRPATEASALSQACSNFAEVLDRHDALFFIAAQTDDAGAIVMTDATSREQVLVRLASLIDAIETEALILTFYDDVDGEIIERQVVEDAPKPRSATADPAKVATDPLLRRLERMAKDSHSHTFRSMAECILACVSDGALPEAAIAQGFKICNVCRSAVGSDGGHLASCPVAALAVQLER